MAHTKRICDVSGCGNPAKARGLCPKHYTRLCKHGSVSGGFLGYRTYLPWLTEHTQYTGDDCLTWPFSVNAANGRGYIKFRGRTTTANRVMCILAHGEPPTEDHEAAHACGKGNEGCVNPKHLRWATALENSADTIKHGTRMTGSKHCRAVLTEDIVAHLRNLPSGVNKSAIARQYGVNSMTIHNAMTGKTWKHVL